MKRVLGTFLAALGAQAAIGAVWAFLNGTFPSDTADPGAGWFNLVAVGLLLIAVVLLRLGRAAWNSSVKAKADQAPPRNREAERRQIKEE